MNVSVPEAEDIWNVLRYHTEQHCIRVPTCISHIFSKMIFRRHDLLLFLLGMCYSRWQPLFHISPMLRPLCRELYLIDLQLFPTYTRNFSSPAIKNHPDAKNLSQYYHSLSCPVFPCFLPFSLLRLCSGCSCHTLSTLPFPCPVHDTSTAWLPATFSQLPILVTPSRLESAWGGQVRSQLLTFVTNSWKGLRSLLRVAASCAAQGCWQGL